MSERQQAGFEIDLCRAWTRLPRSLPLTTTDGRQVDVIHLGTWTHGFGPDFREAIISIANGPSLTGSIEIHLRSRGWIEHRHHLDARYNDVVLHVVGQDDAVETRRADGMLVPVVVLDMAIVAAAATEIDWALVGGDVCAESMAKDNPSRLREAIGALGDLRMTNRAARLEADLENAPPDEVLYREILAALGYAQNRDQMRELGSVVPWPVLAGAIDDSRRLALLLGAAGFLPLSDVELGMVGLNPEFGRIIAATWQSESRTWSIDPLPASTWALARIRPQNHPLRRLVQFGSLLASTDGRLANELLLPVREEVDPADRILELVNRAGVPPLGRDRARTIATNVVIPFAFAWAGMTGDRALADSASTLWGGLRAGEANERTRAGVRQVAGEVGLGRLTERHMQGLIHLTTALCEPRRCYECPVARLVLSGQASQGQG